MVTISEDKESPAIEKLTPVAKRLVRPTSSEQRVARLAMPHPIGAGGRQRRALSLQDLRAATCSEVHLGCKEPASPAGNSASHTTNTDRPWAVSHKSWNRLTHALHGNGLDSDPGIVYKPRHQELDRIIGDMSHRMLIFGGTERGRDGTSPLDPVRRGVSQYIWATTGTV